MFFFKQEDQDNINNDDDYEVYEDECGVDTKTDKGAVAPHSMLNVVVITCHT